MNNYESIKQMSLEEMTITMYVLVAPFAEALNGGELAEADRLDIIDKLTAFLKTEVKKPKE